MLTDEQLADYRNHAKQDRMYLASGVHSPVGTWLDKVDALLAHIDEQTKQTTQLIEALARMVAQHTYETEDNERRFWNSHMSADENAYDVLVAVGAATGNCVDIELAEDVNL